jgi:hypothetical membrane protein
MKLHITFPLRVGVAIPFIYIGTIIVASLFYPGYSQSRQFASELGAVGAPHPWIFNGGLALTGAAEILAAFGFLLAFQRLATNPFLAWITTAIIVADGFSALISAHFPLPDRRHAPHALQMVSLAGPLLFAVTLWKVAEARRLRVFLIFNNIVLVLIFLLVIGVGGFANRQNAGILQRLGILASFPWMSISACGLLRYVRNVPSELHETSGSRAA